VVNNFNVERNNVYLTGWENGGFMVWRLICELGKSWIKQAAIFAAPFGIKEIEGE